MLARERIRKKLQTLAKKFTEPKGPFLAIDLGSTAIKIIEPAISGQTTTIKSIRCHFIDAERLPTEPTEKQNFLTQELVSLMATLKLKNPYVTTSISGSSVIVREAKLPCLEIPRLKEILPTEAESFIPYAINEVNLDFHILGESVQEGGKKYDVILVAAKTDTLEERLGILTASGTRPIVVDVDAFALNNLTTLLPGNQEQTVVMANIGATVTNLAIIEAGTPKVVRDVAIAGETFTKTLQTHLHLTRQKAEEAKKRVGLLTESSLEEDRNISRELEAIARELLIEIHKSIDFYLAHGQERTVHKIYLTGGGSLLKNLGEFASNELKIPIEIFNPFTILALPLDQKSLMDIGPIFSVACGLALRQWGDWIKK